jgi:predicted DNA binding CopG/RHH family protein
MLKMRSVEETMNVGKKWTIEEDNKLVQEITENKTYEEIALEHKRTANSIQLRVISHIIYPKIKNDVETDMGKVALEYNIGAEKLLYNINKLKMKGEPKQKLTQKPKQKEYEPTNKEILDYLQKLDKKIDEINSKLDNLEYLR